MVQQKMELILAGVGRTSSPCPLAQVLWSHWPEYTTLPTDSDSLGMCLEECGQREEHTLGWPGWLPRTVSFSLPGSHESSQPPAGSQGI